MVKGRECSCRRTLPVGLCISFVLLFRGLKQSQLVRSQLQRPESKISYAGPRSRRGWGLSPPTPCPGPQRISWPSPAPGGAVLSPSPSSGAASSLSRASGLPPSPGALYSTQARRHHPWSRSSAPSRLPRPFCIVFMRSRGQDGASLGAAVRITLDQHFSLIAGPLLTEESTSVQKPASQGAGAF